MKKQTFIGFILLVAIFLGGLFLRSLMLRNNDSLIPYQESEKEEELLPTPEKLAEMEQSYETTLSLIYEPFYKDFQAESLTFDSVTRTFERILGLTVPHTYKDFHLQLAFTFNDLRSYLEKNSFPLPQNLKEKLDSVHQEISAW